MIANVCCDKCFHRIDAFTDDVTSEFHFKSILIFKNRPISGKLFLFLYKFLNLL